MALTRKKLVEWGIDADTVEKIINAHAETVSALHDEVDAAKAEAAKKAQSEKLLEEARKELDDLKAKAEADAKEREGKDYDALKKQFDEYKQEQEKLAARAKKEAAFTEILKDAGIPERHYKKIMKYSDVDSIELDDKGKAKDAKELLKAIKEDWGDHVEKAETKGAEVPNPGSGNPSGPTMTKEEIMKIKDSTARQKAISENHELFGF